MWFVVRNPTLAPLPDTLRIFGTRSRATWGREIWGDMGRYGEIWGDLRDEVARRLGWGTGTGREP
jgi:hypothetical protein